LIRYDKDGNQFDEMIYNYENTASSQNYKTNTNKLRWVDDTEPVADHTSDIDDQDIGNYTYDDIGQLIADESEEIANIEWTVYGKVRSVTRKPNSIKPDLEFAYDANGNRVLKSVKNKDGSINITTYLRDASGNVLSIYENNIGATATLAEQFVYGSSRVGTLKPVSSIGVNSHSIGLKEYEVIDHLSNVRVVLSDRQVSGNANVISATDYLPFGMAARIYNNENYRYGFNGQEKDDEIAEGIYTAEFWEYDSRIGRRWNVDPVVKPWESSYACFNNNPVVNVDPKGNDAKPSKKVEEIAESGKKMNDDLERPSFGITDFVKDKDGKIRWDKDANDQATTKEGETYLGKTLTFKFNSYIDGKLWDGPNPPGGTAAGNKLTSTITLTASENEKGELTGLTATKAVRLGETPIGTGRLYYPGLGGSDNIFTQSSTSANGTLSSFNMTFEQHASVSPIEQFGLNRLGYKIVDVAQGLKLNYSGGYLSVVSTTDIFPSATLSVNGVSTPFFILGINWNFKYADFV